MSAIIQYAKIFIESGQNGTICTYLNSGELGTITIRNRAIVAVTLGALRGKAAFAAIQQANIVDTAFWADVVLKDDIQRMLLSLRESHIFAGAQKADATNDEDIAQSADIEPASGNDDSISELSKKKLTELLNRYVGPAAYILIEDALEKARSTNDLIRILAGEIANENDIAEFISKAYSDIIIDE